VVVVQATKARKAGYNKSLTCPTSSTQRSTVSIALSTREQGDATLPTAQRGIPSGKGQ
tara:strand:- start:736 stop:909 length:174 start_codon:yes stop_codon:yes gene_type:complete